MTELVVTRALAASARSDPGRVRTDNEDLAVLDAERGVFGVIDGVGGHAAGELAAAIARDVILQRLARPLGTPAERVREAIAIANNEIFRRAQGTPELAGMTCVVTLALVGEGRLTVGHVGDTRLYKLRPEGLHKLTHDHSPVGEREDAREIDELEAMRHPRRHEVFRDVGSALRDKDEPEYVEVVEDALEDDAAVLLCSDGLTDMIPSTTIERLVRRHAGDVEAVTAALIAAANDAGGRDNVTVVYAEAPGFASALRETSRLARGGETVTTPTSPTRAPRAALWFVLGLLVGLLALAAALAWRSARSPVLGGRVIAAAPVASETVLPLDTALATARSGDTVRLEPGTYPAQAVVPDGVSLRARIPGSVVFNRPAGTSGEWVAITVTGDAGGSVSGLRIHSTPEAPIQVGIRVHGTGRALELMQVDGPMTTAVDVAADAAATLQGSHVHGAAPAVVLGARAALDISGSAFVGPASPPAPVVAPPAPPSRRGGRGPAVAANVVAASVAPAVVVGEGGRLLLERNVFVGFGAEPVKGLPDAERELVRIANVVTTAPSSTVR